MKKSIKHDILMILIGVLLTSLTIVLADTINSNEVLYDNSSSGSGTTDVQGALDTLFTTVNHSGTGYSLLTHNPVGISSTLQGGLYRYQGATVDNYICFGTTDKNTCTADTDKYMYRIIGINTNSQMKLIKKTPLPDKYQRNSVSGTVDLPSTDLFNLLNGEIFLDNTTYIPDNTWKNRIATTLWKYGNTDNTREKTASELYNIVFAFLDTVSAKIGLIYLHDFYYGMPGNNDCSVDYVNCRKSWMFLNNNGSYSGFYEWTNEYYSNNGWEINYNGEPTGHENRNYQYVRPVFNLTSSQIIASGSGTITDPYILGES